MATRRTVLILLAFRQAKWVPVYMGKDVLEELCERLIASLEVITTEFEIVLVDDRSADNAWPLIRELGRRDRRIKGIQLSRNFGQHYALTAGIDHSNARWYCVMDCDLQDAPEDIPALYRMAHTGYDVVVGIHRKEGHAPIKRYTSRLFYWAFNLLAGVELEWNVGNFRVFSDQVANGLRQMREQKLKRAGFQIVFSTSFVSILLPVMIASRLVSRYFGQQRRDLSQEFEIGRFANFIFKVVLRIEVGLALRGVRWPIGGSRVVVARLK